MTSVINRVANTRYTSTDNELCACFDVDIITLYKKGFYKIKTVTSIADTSLVTGVNK